LVPGVSGPITFTSLPKIAYVDEGGELVKFYNYSVHILAYNSIIKLDSGVAANNCGGLNCYTRRMYFKDA
jgi:hypothetical protein